MGQVDKFLNTITVGDNVSVLNDMPAESVDLIFADPPYNLQLSNDLYRPNQTKVDGVFDHWDQFESLKVYDEYTRKWLTACKRVLKKNGSIWVIGSYHNIYRVGSIMQDVGFWFLNDVLWVKTNPMPNFMGTRFNNAHETMLWASQGPKAKFTFHYKAMKAYNDDLQMRSDWHIPICSGGERIKVNGEKAHSTQKPEELLQRVILASSNVGDVILDPFMGSGTTGAVAKKLGRNFIGLEREQFYVDVATERINAVEPIDLKLLEYKIEAKPPKVPFGNLLESGLITAGEQLFDKSGKETATVQANASLAHSSGLVASIHKVSAGILGKQSNNGWTYWYVKRDGELVLIDDLRSKYIQKYYSQKTTETT